MTMTLTTIPFSVLPHPPPPLPSSLPQHHGPVQIRQSSHSHCHRRCIPWSRCVSLSSNHFPIPFHRRPCQPEASCHASPPNPFSLHQHTIGAPTQRPLRPLIHRRLRLACALRVIPPRSAAAVHCNGARNQWEGKRGGCCKLWVCRGVGRSMRGMRCVSLRPCEQHGRSELVRWWATIGGAVGGCREGRRACDVRLWCLSSHCSCLRCRCSNSAPSPVYAPVDASRPDSAQALPLSLSPSLSIRPRRRRRPLTPPPPLPHRHQRREVRRQLRYAQLN